MGLAEQCGYARKTAGYVMLAKFTGLRGTSVHISGGVQISHGIDASGLSLKPLVGRFLQNWDRAARRRLSCPGCAAPCRPHAPSRPESKACSSCGRRGVPVPHDAEPRGLGTIHKPAPRRLGNPGRTTFAMRDGHAAADRSEDRRRKPNGSNLARGRAGSGGRGGGRIPRRTHIICQKTGSRPDIPADPPGGAYPNRNRGIGIVCQAG